MCGIFAYIGKQQTASEIILDGLKTLEYRGYDSWGIAVSKNGDIAIEKEIGKIGDAQTKLPESTLGIGHTRWATHGGVTQINAHPHLNESGKIAVVHNGIVENYHELRIELKKKGHKLTSETDTELIAHLMSDQLENTDFKNALRNTFQHIVGSNAFCVLDNKAKQIGVCRDGSPIAIGLGENEFFIGSDVTPFLKFTKNVIFLDDGQGAILNKDGVVVFDIVSGDILNNDITTIDWEAEDAKKGGYPHFMIKEISEQKTTIAQTASLNQKKIEKIAAMIKTGYKVYVTACGTAAFCAFASQYYFAQHNIQTEAFGAYEMLPFTKFTDDKTIFIAISQSGETAETLIAVKEAKKHGAHVVGVINARGSTLERLADTTMLVGTGPEIAVVSTKAFTAQLATLYQLASACSDNLSKAQNEIKKLDPELESWLNEDLYNAVREVAKELVAEDHIYIIGKHLNYPGAMECALKIKETSYVHAESFAAGELKHGVIALIENGTPCIVLGSDDETKNEILSSAAEVKARGGKILGIAPFSSSEFDLHIKTPDLGPLTIIGNVIVGQLLGYYMAIGRGADPDKPRNLAKSVTVK